MKKYLLAGIITFTVAFTTAYALGDNNSINKTLAFNHNCPYNNETCPYYDETTNTHNCPKNNNCNYVNNHSNNGHGHNKQNGCHRHNH